MQHSEMEPAHESYMDIMPVISSHRIGAGGGQAEEEWNVLCNQDWEYKPKGFKYQDSFPMKRLISGCRASNYKRPIDHSSPSMDTEKLHSCFSSMENSFHGLLALIFLLTQEQNTHTDEQCIMHKEGTFPYCGLVLPERIQPCSNPENLYRQPCSK